MQEEKPEFPVILANLVSGMVVLLFSSGYMINSILLYILMKKTFHIL